MKDSWEMAADRNVSSVLSKLMGFNKPSTPCITPQRHRVLSENYLQNVAFVAKREKRVAYSDDADYDMDVIEDLVECSQGVGVVEQRNSVCRTGKSCFAGRSFSSSYSSSGDRKRTKSLFERSSGVRFQEKRTTRSCKGGKSPNQGSSLSSQEIAKQVTGQVMNSVWHSCAELSRSRPSRTEKSSEIEEEVRIGSSAHLLDSSKKHDTSPFTPVLGSSSMETQKARKQLLEKWRTKKCSQDEMLVTSSDGNCSTTFSTSSVKVKGWPVRSGRYLSKSALFHSAWIPRSRARDFTLDKNWCLKPEKKDSKQYNDLKEDNSGPKDVQSTSESSICGVDSEKLCIHREAPFTFNGSLKLGKEKSSEETFTVTEGHMNHEAHINQSENGCRHLEKDISQGRTVECLFLNCNFAPRSLETGEVADEAIKNKNMSTKLWRENLSAQQTACILLSDSESWKPQSKNIGNASEPGSPVSSLEGPEACKHVLNFTLETEERLSLFNSLENDAHGLQRKLQLIENMSLESGSEGPGMVLSSEEGDDGGSIGWNPKDPQIIEISQTFLNKESCDFSYVVDVVVESGLHMRNLKMESKTWFLQGYALDPLVFDLLENKYGKQVPWEKSERKLLFDRINLGLLEMVKPDVGWSSWRMPVAKRLSLRQKSQELIEDELWWFLANQQEEVEKESYGKVFRLEAEWLDLEEDTSLIVQDIESSLIDELVEKLCMEICFC